MCGRARAHGEERERNPFSASFFLFSSYFSTSSSSLSPVSPATLNVLLDIDHGKRLLRKNGRRRRRSREMLREQQQKARVIASISRAFFFLSHVQQVSFPLRLPHRTRDSTVNLHRRILRLSVCDSADGEDGGERRDKREREKFPSPQHLPFYECDVFVSVET